MTAWFSIRARCSRSFSVVARSDGEQPEVHEEGPLLVGADELTGLVGHSFVDVTARLVADRGVADKLPGREVPAAGARCPGGVGPIHVEALVARLIGVARCHVLAEVPLAKVGRRVARILQRLGQRVETGLQARHRSRKMHPRVARQELLLQMHLREVAARGGDAGARGVLADHDARPRRRAKRAGGVGVREPHTSRREAVEVGSLVEGTAEAAQVACAQVIGKNQHHVGAVRGQGRDGREEQDGQEGGGVRHGYPRRVRLSNRPGRLKPSRRA